MTTQSSTTNSSATATSPAATANSVTTESSNREAYPCRSLSQLNVLGRDRWVLACLTIIPLFCALTLWGVFYKGIAHDLPFGVVDLEHSSLSRKLTHMLDASPTLEVSRSFTSVTDAKQAMVEGEIYGYAIIIPDFSQQLHQRQQPQISVFYNSQYILIGKLINSAVAQVQGYFNAQLDALGDLAKGNRTPLASLGKAVPISTQITALFNTNTNYAQFLVTAVVPAVWQIGIVISTILILAANNRLYGGVYQTGDGTEKPSLAFLGPKPAVAASKILLKYLPIFMLQGGLFLVWFYGVLDWPMHGSIAMMLFAQFLTAIACLIMGALFYFLSLDPARAMSFAGAFTAPSFAFMGITFPVSDMNSWAQCWRSLLPISHYIEVQVEQASYGAPVVRSLETLVPMMGYALPMALCVWLINKHCRAEQINRKKQAGTHQADSHQTDSLASKESS